jgi:hypothetical protein
MPRFIKMLILEQLSEGAAGGGAPAVESKPAVVPVIPAVSAAPEGEGDNYDELGYEKVQATEGDKTPVAAAKPVEKKPEEKPIEPASGYGLKPAVVKEEPVVTPPVAPVKIELGYEVKTEGLPVEEANKILTYAKKHGVTKEAAQEMLDDRKAELTSRANEKVEFQKNVEKQAAKTRDDWEQELKTDPKFGGENFVSNVHKAEKVLQQNMPNTKKMLTERGTKLPPYVMRDLLAMYDLLYGTEKLTLGESIKPPVVEKEDDPYGFLPEMYQ